MRQESDYHFVLTSVCFLQPFEAFIYMAMLQDIVAWPFFLFFEKLFEKRVEDKITTYSKDKDTR